MIRLFFQFFHLDFHHVIQFACKPHHKLYDELQKTLCPVNDKMFGSDWANLVLSPVHAKCASQLLVHIGKRSNRFVVMSENVCYWVVILLLYLFM